MLGFDLNSMVGIAAIGMGIMYAISAVRARRATPGQAAPASRGGLNTPLGIGATLLEKIRGADGPGATALTRLATALAHRRFPALTAVLEPLITGDEQFFGQAADAATSMFNNDTQFFAMLGPIIDDVLQRRLKDPDELDKLYRLVTTARNARVADVAKEHARLSGE